jgi:uncharacterized membrane protein
MASREASPEARPERLAAFSDGVIAVIITIMVLDLKPPRDASPGALLSLWPAFLSYVLSYIFVGIVWINHHHLLRYVERVEMSIIATNFLFLFFVSLIPFCTRYVAENRQSPFPNAVYAANFFVVTIAYILFERAIAAQYRERVGRPLQHSLAGWRNWVGLCCYALAIAAAYIRPGITLALIFCVALIYSVPGARRSKSHV